MDTSETYIKMCEKAYPVLGKKEPEAWDYWRVVNQRMHRHEVHVLSGYSTDGGFYGPGLEDGDMSGYELLFPVYRQDQLQEMLPEFIQKAGFVPPIAANFADFVCSDALYPLPFRTFEQYWLVFVMKERYSKVWNGEDWIKTS